MTDNTTKERAAHKGGIGAFFQTVWVSIEYLSVHLLDALAEDARIIRQEADLFSGMIIFLLGFLNWSSAKYCDGNSSDYLSCTRPATYYYYGAFEIVLIMFGVVLLLLWFVKRRHTK